MGCANSSHHEQQLYQAHKQMKLAQVVQKKLDDNETEVVVIPKQQQKLALKFAKTFIRRTTHHKHKLEQHRGIVDFQRVVSSPTTSIHDYVDVIIDQATTRCNCEVASVFFYDEIKHDMWCVGSKDLEGFSIEYGQGIVGMVATSGKLVNLEDARSSKHFFSSVDEQTGFITKSILAVPLVHPKNTALTIGVLEVINKRATKDKKKQGEMIQMQAYTSASLHVDVAAEEAVGVVLTCSLMTMFS